MFKPALIAASAAALADVPRRGLRFAFNAGIFGYQGPFRLAPYGEVFFLATDRARLVAVARDRQRGVALGAAEHLAKPVEPSDLVNSVARLAGRADDSPQP